VKTVSLNWHAHRGWSGPTPVEFDGPDTLVLVFGPTDLLESGAAFDTIRDAFPQATLAGASSGTVIENGRLDEASLVVSVTRFEHTRIRMVGEYFDSPNQASDDSFACGRRLACQLGEQPGLVAALALADGLLVNGPELVKGLLDKVPRGVPLAGGMAADGTQFGRTWIVADRALRSAAATAIGFYGDRLEVHTACQGGSVGFGPQRRVTHATGNVVFELDGQPALQIYEQYLGDCAAALPGSASHFPLTVYRESQNEAPIIRYVLGIDRTRQSITLAGDVPRGSFVQLSRSGRGELLRAADQVAADLGDWAGGSTAVLNLSVSCFGRRVVLGEQADEEVELVAGELPPDSCQIGFYSYGEISGTKRVPCEMHNMTLALTSLRER
jgi:hypothetical protein